MRKFLMWMVGSLNLLFFLAGIAYFIWALCWSRWYGPASHLDWAIFLGIAITGLFQISWQAYLGTRFLRGDETAIFQATLNYLFALGYLLFVGMSWLLVPAGNLRAQQIVVGIWGVAEGFMAPQLGLYYPFLGLAVVLTLWLEKRRELCTHLSPKSMSRRDLR